MNISKDLVQTPYMSESYSKHYCFLCIFELDNNNQKSFKQCLSNCKNNNSVTKMDLTEMLNEFTFKFKCDLL